MGTSLEAAERHSEDALRINEAWKFLVKLNDALRPLADPIEIQSLAMRVLREHLDVSSAQCFEYSDGPLETVGGYSSLELPVIGRSRLDAYGTFVTESYLAGRTLVVHDAHADSRIGEEARLSWDQVVVRAMIGVPLVKNGNLVAIVGVNDFRPRTWSAGDIACVEEAAERMWTAVARARIELALRESEAWKAFLLTLSDALRPLSDPTVIHATVTHTARDHFRADRCHYIEIENDVATIRQDAHRADLPSVVGVYLLSEWPTFSSMIAAGRPFVVEDVRTSDIVDDDLRERCIQRQILAILNVPVGKTGTTGVLCITQCTPRKWTDFEIALAVQTAERAWAAVQRAQMEEALRTSEENQAFLLMLSDALRPLSNMNAIHSTVTRLARNHFEVDRCYYCEIENDVAIIRDDDSRADLPSIVGTYDLDDFPIFKTVLDEGRLIIVEDARTSEILDENLRRLCIQLQVFSFVNIPVIKKGKPEGVLTISDATPRKWTSFETTLALEIAERTWIAIEHAQTLAALKEANERLIEADRHKNEFLAVLSHELRNPLSPIRNSVYLLERVAPGGEQAVKARQVIDRQTQHMVRLIDDLLDVTRISRGKIVLHRECLDLNAIVRGTGEDHHQMFSRGGVELEIIAVADKPLWVDGDRTRIAQVLGNLLTNSLKFTRRGGKTVLTIEESANQAVIRVCDNGVGMSQETQARVFEPFMQAAQTIERTRGGLGLGLALVKGLVELHDGTVTARSDGEGKGSEFVISLPLCAAPRARTRSGSVTYMQIKRTRSILVVEDHADTAESLREALLLSGHEVVVAKSGPEGLEAARAGQPDIILCDIGLPGITGYEIARSIRGHSNAKLRRTFMVALSGYALPEDVTKSREAGFDLHIAKPPSIDVLEQLLNEAERSIELVSLVNH